MGAMEGAASSASRAHFGASSVAVQHSEGAGSQAEGAKFCSIIKPGMLRPANKSFVLRKSSR
jgi:hypothetical protein